MYCPQRRHFDTTVIVEICKCIFFLRDNYLQKKTDKKCDRKERTVSKLQAFSVERLLPELILKLK